MTKTDLSQEEKTVLTFEKSVKIKNSIKEKQHKWISIDAEKTIENLTHIYYENI